MAFVIESNKKEDLYYNYSQKFLNLSKNYTLLSINGNGNFPLTRGERDSQTYCQIALKIILYIFSGGILPLLAFSYSHFSPLKRNRNKFIKSAVQLFVYKKINGKQISKDLFKIKFRTINQKDNIIPGECFLGNNCARVKLLHESSHVTIDDLKREKQCSFYWARNQFISSHSQAGVENDYNNNGVKILKKHAIDTSTKSSSLLSVLNALQQDNGTKEGKSIYGLIIYQNDPEKGLKSHHILIQNDKENNQFIIVDDDRYIVQAPSSEYLFSCIRAVFNKYSPNYSSCHLSELAPSEKPKKIATGNPGKLKIPTTFFTPVKVTRSRRMASINLRT